MESETRFKRVVRGEIIICGGLYIYLERTVQEINGSPRDRGTVELVQQTPIGLEQKNR